MTATKAVKVSKAALSAANALQSLSVAEQILGLSALLVFMLNHYDISATDCLGIAHNMVFHTDDEYAAKDFKALQQFIKTEWSI